MKEVCLSRKIKAADKELRATALHDGSVSMVQETHQSGNKNKNTGKSLNSHCNNLFLLDPDLVPSKS